MKQEFIKAVKHGRVIKEQTFETEKGVYKIFLARYLDSIYFYKFKDNQLVECDNLSKMQGVKKAGG